MGFGGFGSIDPQNQQKNLILKMGEAERRGSVFVFSYFAEMRYAVWETNPDKFLSSWSMGIVF